MPLQNFLQSHNRRKEKKMKTTHTFRDKNTVEKEKKKSYLPFNLTLARLFHRKLTKGILLF